MLKVTYISSFIIFTVISFGAKLVEEKSCRKGDFLYSPADYKSEIFMKEQYQDLFDSVLSNPVYDCFCNQDIKNLPTKLSRNEKVSSMHKDSIHENISIEPLFIDLKTFDGLYGKRIWKRHGINPKFRCGLWHFLFIISNNKYIPLTNDSIKNVNFVKKELSDSFTKDELDRIISWDIGSDIICSDYTFMWPELIKNDTLIIWDLEKEIEKKKNKKSP